MSTDNDIVERMRAVADALSKSGWTNEAEEIADWVYNVENLRAHRDVLRDIMHQERIEHDAEIEQLWDEIERLREALRRIAATRNTITGTRSWYRCKKIARDALEAGGLS